MFDSLPEHQDVGVRFNLGIELGSTETGGHTDLVGVELASEAGVQLLKLDRHGGAVPSTPIRYTILGGCAGLVDSSLTGTIVVVKKYFR